MPVYFPDCNCCVGVNITVDCTHFTLFNVYLPFESNDHADEYIEKLTLLESHIDNISIASYALVGDFNANFSSANSKFAEHIVNFCNRNNLTLSSKTLLPEDTFTYISERWGSTSWLDHVIASADFHDCLNNINVEYEVTLCDHIPFSFGINFSMLPAIVSENTDYGDINVKTSWKSFSPSDCENYRYFTDVYSQRENLTNNIPNCNDCNCNSIDHVNMLSKTYAYVN